MAQVGDIVRYLNAVGGGRIVRIDGNMAYVDDDGFETPMPLRECVVVGSASAPKPQAEKKAVTPTFVPEQPKAPKPEEYEETETGNLLNIVLAYEPADIKRLNTTTYDAYIVNDSNYYLYFTYLTRADGEGWVTRYAGIVEPNIQLFLCEVTNQDLPSMDRVAIQYVAFKRDKEFALKAPVAVEYRLDTTKFYKLHCFHESVYFDTPVISIDIVKNDIPLRSMVIDSRSLEDAMKAKKNLKADKPKAKSAPALRPETIVVDLHIHELLDTTAGLSNYDMLNVQLREFNRVMTDNLKFKGQKIVFIHGKGEGVLRQAVLQELKKKYPRCQAQDASFREYGFGATQVTIH
ncbi:MAG: DUF2027 domain-containing protein [Muribaculaceae bacterium]|nr:DUF2027 domain-containing protein [Muribaculaceae bacterium]